MQQPHGNRREKRRYRGFRSFRYYRYRDNNDKDASKVGKRNAMSFSRPYEPAVSTIGFVNSLEKSQDSRWNIFVILFLKFN